MDDNFDKLNAEFKVVGRPEAKNLVAGKDSSEVIKADGLADVLIDRATPLRIDQTDARTLARAALMLDGAQQLNRQFTPAEQDRVLDFPAELSTGEANVYGVEDTYRLWAMRDVIQKPSLSTADVVRKIQDLEDAIEGRE